MERNKDFVYLDRFVWDTAKEEYNIGKHKGITFRLAARIFNDPFMYSEYDTEHSEEAGEDRMKNIGLMDGKVLLSVWNAEQGDLIRIFTARKSTKEEKKIYEEHAKALRGY